MDLRVDYDYYIVAFSGGKDSLACLLHLLEIGVPKSKIELWHHEVDGREGSDLFDWPCTTGYVRAIAAHFEIPLYFSWRQGGLEGEMMRDNTPTAAVSFETPHGLVNSGGKSNHLGTRLQFPQTSANLAVRWCSSYAKISVMDVGIAHQSRFRNSRILVITGERREESTNRSKYAEFEPHRKHCQIRHVDHWRPVIDWEEQEVWGIIKRWSVVPHPAYKLGWGRTSCFLCIFSSNDQLASAWKVAPHRVLRIAAYEKCFGKTISFKKVKGKVVQVSVLDRVADGTPFEMNEDDIAQAMSSDWYSPITVPPEEWQLPLGAYGDSAGPS